MSVPPPPLHPSQRRGAAQRRSRRTRERRNDTGDITALRGRLTSERGNSGAECLSSLTIRARARAAQELLNAGLAGLSQYLDERGPATTVEERQQL